MSKKSGNILCGKKAKKNYKKSTKRLGSNIAFLFHGVEIWSDHTCLGYTTLAAKKLGYSDSTIKELVNKIREEFDETTVEEADEYYNSLEL